MALFLLTDESIRWAEKLKERLGVGTVCDSENNDEYIEPASDDESVEFVKRPKRGLYVTEPRGESLHATDKCGIIKQRVQTLLQETWISPAQAIRNIDAFRKDKYLYNPRNKEYVQAAIDDFGKDVMKYSLNDIYNILMVKETPPIFFNLDYGDMKESFKWINDLLLYQFNDDPVQIKSFLERLVEVLDRKIPKLNTIIIKGPPSSGKNFFFDMIFALCNNYGQLGQANKHNLFAFQEAPNKRLLLWNEPNYEPCMTDTIKLMLGGDPYTVKVKHIMDSHVTRTPVIVLTNNEVGFMYEEAFKDRTIKYIWKKADFLKEITKKPYPVSFFHLLTYYEIKI